MTPGPSKSTWTSGESSPSVEDSDSHSESEPEPEAKSVGVEAGVVLVYKMICVKAMLITETCVVPEVAD